MFFQGLVRLLKYLKICLHENNLAMRAHGVTEGTEVNAMSRRCRRHKERRRYSIQILDNYLGINAL